jgi:hypothetical protein
MTRPYSLLNSMDIAFREQRKTYWMSMLDYICVNSDSRIFSRLYILQQKGVWNPVQKELL